MLNVHRVLKEELPSVVRKGPACVGDVLIKMTSRLNPTTQVALQRFFYFGGVSIVSEMLEKARAATLEGLVSQITCPMLCLAAEGEGAEALAQARQFYEALPGTKAFRIFTAEEGADAHCQLNHLGLMQQVVFDWLGEVFTN